MLNTIAQQKSSLENATMNSDVLRVVAGTAKALKEAHNQMDVDKVILLLIHTGTNLAIRFTN